MSGSMVAILGAAPWRFGSPGALLLLVAIPFIVGLLWFGFSRRRRALVVFAGATPQDTRPGTLRAGVKIVLTALGIGSLMLAIARPQADPVEENVIVRGRDVVFIVDVSKSMLSRDAVPNRLSRAKLWINDLVNTLRGDRVGLVAFAGAAVVKSPLTMDYGFFRMALDELSPASVPRGGTLIGDAIRKAMTDVFEQGPGRYRDIVLITDGEDQGSFPAEAAKQAAEQGVRLIVIGIGSEVEGAPVPSEEKTDPKYVEFHGERVRSRLDQTTLAAIAEAASRAAGESGGGGVFLNVGTGTIDLDKVYHDLVGSADQRETETKSNVLYRELFPYFLILAGACLAVEPMIGGRMRIRQAGKAAANAGRAGVAIAGIVIATAMMPQASRAASADAPTKVEAAAPAKPATVEAPPMSADARYNAGRELFLAGKYAEAAEQFRRADIESRDSELSARARFNLGQTLLKQPAPAKGAEPSETPEQVKARLESAAKAFRSALEAKPGDAEAARNVEIARRMLKDFEAHQEKQKQQQDKQSKDGDSKDQKQEKNQKQDGKQDQKDQGKEQKDQQGQQSGKAGEQNQQNADKLKDLAEQQERAADQSKKASEEKNAGEKQKEQEQAKRDQQSVNEKTEQQQKDSDQSAGAQTKEQIEAAQKEQKAASDALEKGDEKTAEEHQRKAAEMLKEAAKAEQDKADQAKQEEAKKEQAKQGEGKNQDKNAKPKEEQPKYDQTASQLLDKERKERDARQQVLRALRGRPVPVEKDW